MTDCSGINSYGGACSAPVRYGIAVARCCTDLFACARHLSQVIDAHREPEQAVTVTRLA